MPPIAPEKIQGWRWRTDLSRPGFRMTDGVFDLATGDKKSIVGEGLKPLVYFVCVDREI
jgi:hypothetical protein